MSHNLLNGLTAACQPNSTLLILGSMPGTISLTKQQYYAHPRNLFWPIMSSMLSLAPELSYEQKLFLLNEKGVALWDVIASCERQGSLDSAIKHEQVNDFAAFFNAHPKLLAIGFNGAKAWQSFKRHVLPLNIVPKQIALITLPSTSPAHASVSFDEKLKSWQQLSFYIQKR